MTAELPGPPESSSTARRPDPLKLPGWALVLLGAVFAGATLAAASARWVGVALIVALVAGVCALLLRWSQ